MTTTEMTPTDEVGLCMSEPWQVRRARQQELERWADRLRSGRHFLATPEGLREILDPFGTLGPVVDRRTLRPVAGVAS